MDRRRILQGLPIVAFSGTALAQGSRARQPERRGAAQTAPAEALPPTIAALPSRKAEAVPITVAEREKRVERARALMGTNRISALMLAGGTSLAYFTGLRWTNSERLLAYVLPAKGNGFLVCPAFEEERMRERLGTMPGGQDARVYVWQEDESPYTLLRKGLQESGASVGRLGIEERTPYRFVTELAKVSPGLQAVDGTPVTAGCRMIKSQAELALMRLASQVTLQVYEAAWKAAHPGMTTEEFSRLISVGYGRVGFPGEASCNTGAASALPHGSDQPQVIRENEIVLIDDGCSVEGYQSDLSRAFVYGKPTAEMERIFETVQQAQKTAAAAAKAGAECQVVDAVARQVIAVAGYGSDYKSFPHRVGHGIGMDGHEWPYLVKGNTMPMQAGMTFSDEPGVYLKGQFGIRLEDDMVVTSQGGELLTPQSRSLTEPFGV